MARILTCLVLALFPAVLLPACGGRDGLSGPGGDGSGDATVIRVVDGDTLVVDVDGVEEHVRLIGIDTPESTDPRQPVECFGSEASARTAELVPAGTAVRLERDVEARDRYDRLLAYVFRRSDSLFVNLAMVEDGFAEVLTIAPNVAYLDRFSAAGRVARVEQRGLWAACDGNP